VGKVFNAGQTCIAPDYVLAQEKIYPDLVHRFKEKTIDYYGKEPQKSADFARIINKHHFNRLQNLINTDKVVHGGEVDPETLFIGPTIMDQVTLDDAVMGEEIFGPLRMPSGLLKNIPTLYRFIYLHVIKQRRKE